LSRCFYFCAVVAALWLPGGRLAAALPPSAAQAAAISEDAFAAELGRVQAEIGAASTAAEASAEALGVPARWRVRTADGIVDVPADWLHLALRQAAKDEKAWPAARAALQRRLEAMRSLVLDRVETASPAAAAEARAVLASVLAQSEFQRGAYARLRDSLQARIGEWIEQVWSRLGGGPGAGRKAATALAWAAGIAALVGLGGFLVRTIVARSQASSLALESAPLARRARDLALLAARAIDAGNLRDAVRWGYGAALARLEEEGAWHVDPARTPREYLTMLEPTDTRRGLMLDLTGRFERIWYGNRPPAPDDGARVVQHLEVLGCLRPGERAI
jgi:hypothetical protein